MEPSIQTTPTPIIIIGGITAAVSIIVYLVILLFGDLKETETIRTITVIAFAVACANNIYLLWPKGVKESVNREE